MVGIRRGVTGIDSQILIVADSTNLRPADVNDYDDLQTAANFGQRQRDSRTNLQSYSMHNVGATPIVGRNHMNGQATENSATVVRN